MSEEFKETTKIFAVIMLYFTVAGMVGGLAGLMLAFVAAVLWTGIYVVVTNKKG